MDVTDHLDLVSLAVLGMYCGERCDTAAWKHTLKVTLALVLLQPQQILRSKVCSYARSVLIIVTAPPASAPPKSPPTKGPPASALMPPAAQSRPSRREQPVPLPDPTQATAGPGESARASFIPSTYPDETYGLGKDAAHAEKTPGPEKEKIGRKVGKEAGWG